MKIILVIILYIGIVSACTKKPIYPEAMSQAIRCVETSPDSALLYLNSLSPATFQAEPKETRMYYDLLKIKANDKLYHEQTSDSTILEIVRFYDEYGDLHKQMEAYYYLGSVYRDLGDAPRAVKAFLHATELGENTMEYGLMGKAYGQICILLDLQSIYDEAERAGKKELEYALLRNDSVAVGYSLRNIARIFHDRHELDSALHYYMEGYEKGAMRIKNIILSEVPWIYYDKGEPEQAKSLIFELFNKGRYSYNNWLLLGRIYAQEGELGKAHDCFNTVLTEGQPLSNTRRIPRLVGARGQAGKPAGRPRLCEAKLGLSRLHQSMEANRGRRKNPSPIQFPSLRGGKQPAARSEQSPSTLAFIIDLRANRISKRRLSILQ